MERLSVDKIYQSIRSEIEIQAARKNMVFDFIFMIDNKGYYLFFIYDGTSKLKEIFLINITDIERVYFDIEEFELAIINHLKY